MKISNKHKFDLRTCLSRFAPYFNVPPSVKHAMEMFNFPHS